MIVRQPTMITYGSKVYRIEESLSGEREDVRAESAVEAAIKYLKHDALIVKSNDKKKDTFGWYLEVERIR